MGVSLKNLVAVVNAAIERNTQYIESRIMTISIIATVCFPLYYIIWHYVFPQPYENLWLRLLGATLFIPPIFVKYWPQWMSKLKPIYWYFATLYTLPFFFTFMLLKNDGSDIWLSSTLVAVFLMLLWLDWLNVIIQSVLGILFAWSAYYLTTDVPHVTLFTVEYIPIYSFAIVVGIATNYSAEVLRQERLRAMLVAASNIAHELRTPLLGIKSGASGLQRYLPTLLETYRMAKEHGLEIEPIRTAHLYSMQGVLERIEGEADHSNIIIDMLLMNARMDGGEAEKLSDCSIGQCVETALRRYPFASERERQLVEWNNGGTDFTFRGVELLMVHVLFNLLKNALYHVARAGKGEISIRLEKMPHGNALIFRDTGTGILPEVLPHIFARFYSWSADNRSGGAGIGLAFCRSVMESFGGTIRCKSEPGEYAEFVLAFPAEVVP